MSTNCSTKTIHNIISTVRMYTADNCIVKQTLAANGHFEEPLFPSSDLGGIVSADPKKPFDIRKVSVVFIHTMIDSIACGGDLTLLLCGSWSGHVEVLCVNVVANSFYRLIVFTISVWLCMTGVCLCHRQIIARLVDGSVLHEFKKDYGKTIICGFAKLYGMEIGIVANNGILFSDSSLKVRAV